MPERKESGKYGFYFAGVRTALEHPLVSWESEEIFENGRRLDMRVLHPFWDSELIEMLWSTPPELLNRGGRAKALLRDVVARRFPDLGFEGQKKVEFKSLFSSAMTHEGADIWREMDGAKALVKLGLADNRELGLAVRLATGTGPTTNRDAFRAFCALNMEYWLRGRL